MKGVADFEEVGCALGVANGVTDVTGLWAEVSFGISSFISVEIGCFSF